MRCARTMFIHEQHHRGREEKDRDESRRHCPRISCISNPHDATHITRACMRWGCVHASLNDGGKQWHVFQVLMRMSCRARARAVLLCLTVKLLIICAPAALSLSLRDVDTLRASIPTASSHDTRRVSGTGTDTDTCTCTCRATSQE